LAKSETFYFASAKANFRLSGAKLLFSYNLPFLFLAEKTQYKIWGSLWDDIRNYFISQQGP